MRRSHSQNRTAPCPPARYLLPLSDRQTVSPRPASPDCHRFPFGQPHRRGFIRANDMLLSLTPPKVDRPQFPAFCLSLTGGDTSLPPQHQVRRSPPSPACQASFPLCPLSCGVSPDPQSIWRVQCSQNWQAGPVRMMIPHCIPSAHSRNGRLLMPGKGPCYSRGLHSGFAESGMLTVTSND